MKRILLFPAMALALAACGYGPAKAASRDTTDFKTAHAGKYCDRASSVKKDTEAKVWVYDRDDDGPAGSTRVQFRRRGVTLVVDYDSTMTVACIVGKSYDQPSDQAQFVAKHQDDSHCRAADDFFDWADEHNLVEVGEKGNRYTYMDKQQHVLVVDVSMNEVCFVSAK